MHITQGLDLDNCICCLFSVLCLWQCNDLVRSPYCALLMSPRCCQSQGWDSHPRRGVQLDMTLGLLGFRPHLSLGRVYKLHIPSLWDIPIPHFLCVGFFCVFCTPYFALLMAHVCWEYRGRDSAGEGKDTGT